MTTLTVPDITFAGFYYPEILRELLLFLRRNKERLGLTDENVLEVHTQMVRAFAVVGHLCNTRLDTVASELLLDSAQLLESVKRLLRLIGIELASASPAVADILLELSTATSINLTDFVPELAEFSTESVPPIGFEALASSDLDRTDQVSYAYGLEVTKTGVGKVETASPDIFERTSGGTFADTDLNSHLFVPVGLSDNGGEFRITEVIDANRVRVVRVPNSTSPGFQTETTLSWTLKAFTADGAASVNTAGPTFTPWASTPVVGDVLYVAHAQAMWDQIDIALDTIGGGIFGVWEYPDNRRSNFNPASVVDNGDGTLTFDCNPLLGLGIRVESEVIVTYLPTGVKERASSFFNVQNKITTQTTLGQITPSTSITDYQITADWIPLDNQDDGTEDLIQDGTVTYSLPQTRERSWLPTEVNLVEAMWLRYRLTIVSVGSAPVFDTISISGGRQYLLVEGTQGETVGPQVLGSSDGSPSQSFELPDTPYIDDTETIEVDETGGGNWIEYIRVENFLSSQATSRHYVLESSAEDVATIRFGDGTNGKIPPAGTDNVRGAYRIGGDIDGNVAADEIVVNADGIQNVSSVTNPRPASGWRMKDGGTDDDLLRVKREAPASLRTRDRGVNDGDVARLAVNDFVNSDGIKPVARAYAIEEGLGVKTVKLLVVGSGGSTLSATEKEELDVFFNGDRYASPEVEGKLVLNHQVTTFNYEPETIGVQATVVWPGGSAESVRNTLLALLNPLALEEDGVTYVWDFGGTVSLSRIYAAIHGVDPNVEDVSLLQLNGAGASVILGSNGLPVSTAAGIVVNIAEN